MKQVWVWLLIFLSSASFTQVTRAETLLEAGPKIRERQLRRLLEPLLESSCHESCKILSIHNTLDATSVPETHFPGFDDLEPIPEKEGTWEVKILLDEHMGSHSRTKLTELIQQYLDNLDFSTKLQISSAHFPLSPAAENKIAELREKITKQFVHSIEDFLRQFCPQSCLLGDFDLQTETVNTQEVQYETTGEYFQEGDTAIKIKSISATILLDDSLTHEEQDNILGMARMKTSSFRRSSITGKVFKFPHPLPPEPKTKPNRQIASEPNEANDRLQNELQKFKILGLIFAVSLALLVIFVLAALSRNFRNRNIPITTAPANAPNSQEKVQTFTVRYEIEHLYNELLTIYGQQPKVAKQVFSRILTEDGVETTAECIHLFGEGIITGLLRDPSLKNDINKLLEYYAKTQIELPDEKKLQLLKNLHNKTVAGKLIVMSNRSAGLFDFLDDFNATQILDLIQTESITVKAIVLTQCDLAKRTSIYSQMDPDLRMEILAELSRIDYLPRDFISNVSAALKQKMRDNPKLNTEALPGSEVMVSLLERTSQEMQKAIIRKLGHTHPESVQTIKNKLISLDTLLYLPDTQILDVVLSLKHDELVQFLKHTSPEIRTTIFSKSPKDLVAELEEEIEHIGPINIESYHSIERKVLNRIKILSSEGHLNLLETNERLFASIPDPEAKDGLEEGAVSEGA